MSKEATPTEAPDEWALVEIMGHQRFAGRIMEVTRFGASMLRLDQPVGDPGEEAFVTKFFGGSSIYAVTPCAEEIARRAAAQMFDPRPVAPMAFRLPSGTATAAVAEDDEELPF